MGQDDDLSALLPKSPPPRPDRREAAISAAMRRFDGADEPQTASHLQSRENRPRSGVSWGRPQLGAVLATGIIALIALPIWMSRGDHRELARPEVQPRDVTAAAPAKREAPIVSPPPTAQPGQTVARADQAHSPAVAPSAEPKLADAVTESDQVARKSVGVGGSLAAPEARLGADYRAAPSAPSPIVLAEPAPAIAPPAVPPPPAMAARGRASVRDEEANDVIVTARRIDSSSDLDRQEPRRPQARRTSKRGDWNACTVNDPERNLGACGEGRAADGLARAWRGDLDGAIADFDAAIAASPQSDGGYLNRGLAYERKGDTDRALADLDRAVRQAPSSARAYYNRSLVLRRKGEKDRAEADADRAVDLDPRYSAVIK